MKKLQFLVFLLVFGLFGYSSSLRAEDIDIYVSNSTNVGVPNVMFVIFNGADMDADSGNSCTYPTGNGAVSGSAPSAGASKVIGLIQCALINAITHLTD